MIFWATPRYFAHSYRGHAMRFISGSSFVKTHPTCSLLSLSQCKSITLDQLMFYLSKGMSIPLRSVMVMDLFLKA
jgi:hypothetical protein